MALDGPIVLIEDDKDDQTFALMCLKKLGIPNEIRVFSDGAEALNYLNTTSENPFLVISDINMPKMNGLELRRSICESKYLKRKSIPFVFLSGSASPKEINEAFELSVQGFFIKTTSIDDLRKKLTLIVEYWKTSKEPNTA